jgi:hypothetical protein
MVFFHRLTVTPYGPPPTGIVAVTVLVSPMITDTVSLKSLAT